MLTTPDCGPPASVAAEALDEVQRMTEAQLQHNWSASTYGGMAPSSAVSVRLGAGACWCA